MITYPILSASIELKPKPQQQGTRLCFDAMREQSGKSSATFFKIVVDQCERVIV